MTRALLVPDFAPMDFEISAADKAFQQEVRDFLKKRFLPPMLKGETNWCQGFSEPGSGSDLASLRTRADLVKDPAGRDGDHYVINGAKIWTSNAHQADWIFILVRTNQEVKKQAG